MPTVDQPTKAPTRKVLSGGLWGALAVLVLGVGAALGLDVPGVDEGSLPTGEALTLLVTGAAAWFTRERA